MRGKPVYIRRYDFSGMVNQGDDPAIIKENQVADIRNWTQDASGVLVKREGWDLFYDGSPSSKVYKLFRFHNGSNLFLMILANELWFIPGVTTGSAAKLASYSNTSPVGMATWQNRVFITHASNGIYQWDGSANDVSVISGAPASEHIVLHNNRLFASKGTTLYYSEEDDYSSWSTASDYIPVYNSDGQAISGLLSQAGGLLIIKTNSLCYLYGYGPDEWVLRKEINGVGAIARESVATGMGMTFFLGRDGVYSESGGNVYRISDPVQPLLDRLSLDDLADAVGVYHNRKYYLSIREKSGDAGNSMLLVYDAEKSHRANEPIWEPWDSVGGSALVSLTQDGDAGYLLIGSPQNDAKLYRINGPDDDGDDIAAYIETGRLVGDQYDTWFQFEELWVDAVFPEGGSIEATWTTYGNQGDTNTGTITLNGAGRKRLPSKCQGRDMTLKFEVDDDLVGWEFRGFTVKATKKRENR